MAKAEIKFGEMGGGELSVSEFSAKFSVSAGGSYQINAKKGDYIVVVCNRSTSGYNITWNGQALAQGVYYSIASTTNSGIPANNFVIIFKVEQDGNQAIGISSGGTVTLNGCYSIIRNQ